MCVAGCSGGSTTVAPAPTVTVTTAPTEVPPDPAVPTSPPTSRRPGRRHYAAGTVPVAINGWHYRFAWTGVHSHPDISIGARPGLRKVSVYVALVNSSDRVEPAVEPSVDLDVSVQVPVQFDPDCGDVVHGLCLEVRFCDQVIDESRGAKLAPNRSEEDVCRLEDDLPRAALSTIVVGFNSSDIPTVPRRATAPLLH
jgi:hypothetical protein